jgi:hypothetical protein
VCRQLSDDCKHAVPPAIYIMLDATHSARGRPFGAAPPTWWPDSPLDVLFDIQSALRLR